MAREVDGVLMAVEAGRTERAALQRATEALTQVGANVIRAVINRVPTGRGGYYGYYEGCREDGGGRKARRRSRKRGDVRAKGGGEEGDGWPRGCA